MFGFKGGKGVATMIGILAAINPIVLGILVVYGIILFIVTRIVSIASITAAILLPVLMFLNGHTLEYVKGNNTNSFSVYLGFSILFALIILFNHRENIRRLKDGSENRFVKNKEDKEENA